MTAYAYARWSLPLFHYPWAKEITYVVLLIVRIAPLGILAYHLFPPAMSSSGSHSLQMFRQLPCGHMSRRLFWKIRLRAIGDTLGITFVVAFFLTFHEFEIASLNNIDTWTVRLFDAHAGGLPWAESLRTALFPVIFQSVFVLSLAYILKQRPTRHSSVTHAIRAVESWRTHTAWVLVGTANLVVVFLPTILIVSQASTGFAALSGSSSLQKEIAASLLFGISGGALGFALSFLNTGRLCWLAALPGLCGPLLLALATIQVFQWGPLRTVYDSPIPLIIVLALLILPVALLSGILRRRISMREASFVATLSRARRPGWILQGRSAFGTVAVLCFLAYSDLSASAILAPPGMTTAPARLYNLMHYGQTAVLSALTLATFLIPLAAAIATWSILELRSRT